jgi:hypothetical protein
LSDEYLERFLVLFWCSTKLPLNIKYEQKEGMD